MNRYVDVVYNERIRPFTNYPRELCKYLFGRFGLKQGDKLLDIGCGRGDFSKSFKDLNLEVYGLDCEESSSLLLENIQVRLANIENEPFPFDDNMFDVVFAKSVIEHLFNPENFMKECYRILKPSGRLIIMTPDWISQMKIFFDDYTHRQPYTLTALKDILDIFLFKDVSSEIFYQIPILWKYPALKAISGIIRLLVPVTAKSNIRFIRWSTELMILGTGVK